MYIFKDNYKNYPLGIISIFCCLITVSRSSILSLFVGCLVYFASEILFKEDKKSICFRFYLTYIFNLFISIRSTGFKIFAKRARCGNHIKVF